MSTRSILAVRDADDILGVYHRFDSYPAGLGNALLAGILERGGDLRGAVDAWIRGAPKGWSWLPAGQRSDDPDQRPFYRRADLAQQGWVEWVYVFDEAARTLSIWAGNPAFDDRWAKPDSEVTFAADGRATPPVFASPDPPWHGLPVGSGWEGDTDAARTARAAFAAAIAERVEDPAAFASALTAELATRLEALEWQPLAWRETDQERHLRGLLGLPRPPFEPTGDTSLRMSFFGKPGDRYWSLRLGTHVLCFPTAACFRQDFDPVLLHRRDGASATLDLSTLPADPYAVLVEAAAAARRPGDWRFEDGELFAFSSVVDDDAVTDPTRQLPLSRARKLDPEVERGDVLGVSEPLPAVHWRTLEWLRAFQVPEA
jgi:hypothetical protein